jgi:hypothetical protein
MPGKMRLLVRFLEKHYPQSTYSIAVQKTENALGDKHPEVLKPSATRIIVKVGGHEYMDCDVDAFDKWIEREILV